MMKATIKDFMGCSSADIIADKIALLLGHNGQGKTSSLLPISAALRGGVPLGMQKTKAGMLVKIGSGSASVVLENETSKVSVSWPKCERRSDGADAPEASDIAVGAVKFPAMADKEKVELLRSILSCEPVEADLRAALSEAGLSDKICEVVWHAVSVDGWDASLERAKEKGRSLKSQWGIIAGETYGEKKAASWFPAGWDNDLEGASAEALESDVTIARADLDDKIANQALSDDELARLQALSEKAPDLQKKVDDMRAGIEEKEKAYKNAVAARKALPELPNYDLKCPSCGKPLVYQFGHLEEVKQMLSDADRAELDQKVLDADNAVSKTQRELNADRSALAVAENELRVSLNAELEYDMKKGKTVSGQEVDDARNAVRKAEARLSAFNKYNEALRVHNSIVENQHIINVLEPEGIRRQSLEKGLTNFNDHLDSLCRIAGWNAVAIDGDMTVNYGGRPFVLCSESEKFRTVAVLQMAIAEADNSVAVVVDAADILDNKGRAGLLKLLAKMPFVSFVGMTVSKPESTPNLKKLGIGRKYWIENGNCEEVYNG